MLEDLDNDGVPEAVAQLTIPQGLYVMFLRRNGTVRRYQKITETDGGGGGLGLEPSEEFGSSPSELKQPLGEEPDMTRLLVGSRGANDGGTKAGQVHVMRMNTNGTINSSVQIHNGEGGLPVSTTATNS